MLIFRNTKDIFARLLDAGMYPIVTHPERNGLIRQRIDELAAWFDAGAYLQVTGQSLLGRFGKPAQEFARTLLERGLVHFIASDGHHVNHRPPTMDGAFAWIEQNHGRALAEAVCIVNPRAALTGDPVDLPERVAPTSSRRWYQLWR
jgi:protein-tyrosine phosphatase